MWVRLVYRFSSDISSLIPSFILEITFFILWPESTLSTLEYLLCYFLKFPPANGTFLTIFGRMFFLGLLVKLASKFVVFMHSLVICS